MEIKEKKEKRKCKIIVSESRKGRWRSTDFCVDENGCFSC
jgi:hypothetical protein